MKYMVLKVAAGVFLGIAAAFGVYKVVQIWEARKIAQAYLEQQISEAKAAQKAQQDQEARINETAKHLHGLPSEEVVKRCGPPLKDRFGRRPIATNTVQRYMSYLGEDRHTIRMEFWCYPEVGCGYMGMQPDEPRSIYESNTPEDYEDFRMNKGKMHDGRLGAVKELPCLVPKD